jgi:hypothetical protein
VNLRDSQVFFYAKQNHSTRTTGKECHHELKSQTLFVQTIISIRNHLGFLGVSLRNDIKQQEFITTNEESAP